MIEGNTKLMLKLPFAFSFLMFTIFINLATLLDIFTDGDIVGVEGGKIIFFL